MTDADQEPKPEDDLAQLARRYMDLWQDHLSAVAQDQETAEVMAKTMAMMSSGAQAAADPDDRTGPASQPSGAEAAAALDGGAGADPVQLLERIAALEKRVDELEAERKSGGRGPSRKTKDG